MAYRDYTPLKNHEVTMWKLSDSFHLTFMGGLVGRIAVVSVAVGFAVGMIVGIPLLLAGMSGVWGMLTGGTVAVWFYLRSTNERVKSDPLTNARRRVRHALAPRRYIGGSTAETRATRLHWQIILWRPDSDTARVGPVRRFNTYTPQPVGYDERRKSPPSPADILLGRGDPFGVDNSAYYEE